MTRLDRSADDDNELAGMRWSRTTSSGTMATLAGQKKASAAP
jgi:hypothetical protein